MSNPLAYIVTTDGAHPESNDLGVAVADLPTLYERMVKHGLSPENSELWGSGMMLENEAGGWFPIEWTEQHKAEFGKIQEKMR